MRGYLRPGQLAFLLAAQLVARHPGDELLERVRGSLSANHANALEAARELLQRERTQLVATLGLPAEAQWPAPKRLEDALGPLPPVTLHVRDTARQERERARADRIGFRVASDSRKMGFVLGGSLGFVAALELGLERTFWPAALGAAALGWILGPLRRVAVCSGCEHKVARDAEQCGFCDLVLVGDIAQRVDRMAAEEEYLSARKARR
jgi:hypothetical protein